MKRPGIIAAIAAVCTGLLSAEAARGQGPDLGGPAGSQVVPVELRFITAERGAWWLAIVQGPDCDVAIKVVERLNVVLIQAPEEKLRRAKAILERLDEGYKLYTPSLKHVRAVRTATLLRRILLLRAFLTDPPVEIVNVVEMSIKVDERTNSLIIHAPAEQIRQCKQILRWLDRKWK
jgi:type II secretory pathway component GspD/PulD (secretin)